MSNGVIQGIDPIRLYQYEQICGATEKEYPTKFRLNDAEIGLVVKDQGNIGACVGCATSTVLEALTLREVLGKTNGEEITDADLTKELLGAEEFSHWFTYGYCRDDSLKGEGMIPSICLDYLHKKGTVPIKYFDIAQEMPEIKDTVQQFPELFPIAEKYAIGGYVAFALKNPDKDRQIKDALMKYRTPLPCVSPKGFVGGGHCICLIGWDDEANTYIIKNSWGKDYGENGVKAINKDKIREVFLMLSKEVQLPFTDVKQEDWFYSAVRSANLSGIMTGRTDTEFVPYENMTRAEMSTVVSRLLEAIDERLENFSKQGDN